MRHDAGARHRRPAQHGIAIPGSPCVRLAVRSPDGDASAVPFPVDIAKRVTRGQRESVRHPDERANRHCGPDSPAHAATDAPTDAPSDAPSDAGPDTRSDTRSDTRADRGRHADPADAGPGRLGPQPHRGRVQPRHDCARQPLAVTNAGDGTGRLFVASQGGAVYIVSGGAVNPTPFLDISTKVSRDGGERGLLGLAFHPSDNRVFVDYTNGAGDTVVSSFRVDLASPNAVLPAETQIIKIDQPYANHNGGAIQFGPDGFLYISTGDGGGSGDPDENGQNTATLLGKILRIDVDHPSGDRNYGIPGSNPFGNEVWHYGLRNPFRFSFDRTTGDLWIGDVGQNAWEEVDVARAGVGGLNFGWDDMEGNHCFEPSSNCATSGRSLPVVEYPHVNGHCAVIGGNVYRGSAYPILRGGYVFSDECSGYVWALDPAGSGPQALVYVGNGAGGIAGYGEDEAGELYAVALGGQLYRVTAAAR